MEEMIKQIKDQQDINFINIREQILVADLETVFDAENNSRYIFHYLHSMDRFYINPMDYVYEGEKLFGIPENLSVIDPKREGYEKDSSIVISREQLLKYLDYVKAKIDAYFERLTVAELLEKPSGSDYTRLELILAQFRHMMWHVGVSSAITFNSKKEWNRFTGLTKLNKRFFAETRNV